MKIFFPDIADRLCPSPVGDARNTLPLRTVEKTD